jgi:hypothetical protein
MFKLFIVLNLTLIMYLYFKGKSYSFIFYFIFNKCVDNYYENFVKYEAENFHI